MLKKIAWALGSIAALFALIYAGIFAYVLYDQKYGFENFQQGVADANERLGDIRITRADVDGSKLPPEPDKALNDSTVAGTDSNGNYVRDDVERSMFDIYPITLDEAGNDTNLIIRAAALQYAQAFQLRLTEVNSEEEMEVVGWELDSAVGCIFDLTDNYDGVIQGKIRDLYILNTKSRKDHYEATSQKYFRGGTSRQGEDCDIQ